MLQSSQSTCFVWSKTPKFHSRHKSPFRWLCIFLTERKFQKLVRNNLKRNWNNSEKQEKETTFLRKSSKKFCSKSTKTLSSRKNLAMSSTTCSITVKILRKCLKPKFTSTSNAIGNTSPLNRSQSRSHQLSLSEKSIFWGTLEHVLQFQLMSSKLFSAIWDH